MMHVIESFIYNKVKKNSSLKNKLKFFYQSFFSMFGMLRNKINTNWKYDILDNSFFGFHDRPSMNKSGLVITHKTVGQFVDGVGTADIQIYNFLSKSVTTIATTNCCNYQQASLATWFDNDNLIFNNSLNGQPVTIIHNVYSQSESVLPFHFFSISNDAQYISSVNFLRFGNGLSGYGYDIVYPKNFVHDAIFDLPSPGLSDFVIYSLNPKNKDLDENVSLTHSEVFRLALMEAKKLSSRLISDGYFYFSHSKFSPSSQKVYFLLRSSNTLYNSSQLFVFDILKSKLSALPTGGMVSHLDWLDEHRVLAFCNTLSNEEYAYYIFDTSKNNEVVTVSVAGLNKDGHPNSLSQNKFLTDTYPDKYRRQYLYIVDLISESKSTILDVYSPMRFRNVNRVDFHPRLSMCKKFITIDSSHTGSRSQMVLQIPDVTL